MNTQEMIDRFSLQDKVAEFVAKEAATLCQKENSVSFSGHCSRCSNPEPHVPHVTGSYHTVRYGELDQFCPGREGARLCIVETEWAPGSAASPARYSASWHQLQSYAVEVVDGVATCLGLTAEVDQNGVSPWTLAASPAEACARAEAGMWGDNGYAPEQQTARY